PRRTLGAMLPALHAFLPFMSRDTTTSAWLLGANLRTAAKRIVYHAGQREVRMSAVTAAPTGRDVRVISLIGVAHGVSHYYQLAFITMLLIVRERVGLSFIDVGILSAVFYGVSGTAQTAAGFAVDRFGARPILAGGLATIGIALALVSIAH